MRWGAHIGVIAAIVLSLVGLSVIAVVAARDARTTAAEVRESSAVWNAYQQARYSVVQEALLTQEYRLAASPAYEERFGEAAADLAAALETVERSAKPADRGTAARVRTTNAALIAAVPGLVDAINAGDAARAERIATERLEPLFESSISTVERAAASHRADSRAGLVAAERAETVTLASALAVFLLGLLLAATTAAALRLRRRLDDARRTDLDRLRVAALTDSLTGVLNHRAFHEDLAEALAPGGSARAPVLIMLDLNDLKAVNDRYGHHAGDEQIKLLAATVDRAVSDPDRLYRLGGDEFAVVLRDSLAADALRLTEAIHDAFPTDGSHPRLRFSAGIAQHEDGMAKDELVRRADLALIEAKRLRQKALVYSQTFEIAVETEPEELRHLRVLANALARAVDTKDAYTNSHCETVAELCAVMAVELGFDEQHVFKIRLAGLLHDVGKIGVPDSILQKPGPLTEDEYEVMKTHPVLGAHILRAAERHVEARWVHSHHERPDGKGYPDGTSEISLEASIIAVADAFEAMVSRRPYREPRSVDEALAELARCAGTQFEPRCVAALTAVLGRTGSGAPALVSELPPPAQSLPLGAAAA
ncbi:MAG TPA: diguanylate cyclase [Gaiellaceae bacterium]|jgi:diguanylate cyclase (GGDEF)-like protein/putative nucleotidyltransferase with HDIG domain